MSNMRKSLAFVMTVMVIISTVFVLGTTDINTVYGADAISTLSGPGGNLLPVSTISELNSAIASAQPGDIIELADGTYNGTINSISGKNGTADRNIIIRAKNVDQAVLAGPAKFDLSNCSYITIEGMKITSSVTVGIKLNSCNNIRITKCRLRTTEKPGVDNKYVLIQGANSHHNRIDRNIFEEKHEMGQMLAIHGSSTQVSQYDVVELNYFKNFYPGTGNGYETIRVGLSGISMSSGYTIIQNNLFENTDGENECISLKACDLTVRYNTFRNVSGECTSRHGNRHSVYGNYFISDGVKANTAGIRAFGQDHKYYNNVFIGLTGTAIVLNGGAVDTSGPLNGHWRQYRAEVAFNTIIDCAKGLTLGGKIYPPIDTKIADNIFQGSTGTLFDEISSENTLWQGNTAYATGSAVVGISKEPSEINVIDPQLAASGELYRLSGTSPAIDAASGTYSYVTDDMDGQPRTIKDIGADEYSTAPVTHAPLAAIQSIAPVNIDTVAGIAPALPDTVSATYTSGSTHSTSVLWDPIEAGKYAQEGTFTVYGTVYDSICDSAFKSDVTAVATVKVYPAPSFSLEVNGNSLPDKGSFEDYLPLKLRVWNNTPELLSTKVVIMDSVIPVTSNAFEADLDMAGKTGTWTASLITCDKAGNTLENTLQFTVTTGISSVRQLIERYKVAGELQEPLLTQITNSLDQAEKFIDKGKSDQAAKHMEDFIKHLDNKAHADKVSTRAKEALINDANYFIQAWSH